jgi:aerobic carbon-monoxide dehydrogenase medium subunit
MATPPTTIPALMLALGASFVLKGPSGERVVPSDGFFISNYVTLLQPAEIMTEIRIPVPAPNTGYAIASSSAKSAISPPRLRPSRCA